MSVTITWRSEGTFGGDNKDGYSHTRVADMVSSSALDTIGALAATGVPALGDAHPSAAGLLCTSRDAQNQGNGLEWVITIEYSKEFSPNSPKDETPTAPVVSTPIPTDEDWEIDIDYLTIELPYYSLYPSASIGGTISGTAENPNINTAGDKFTNPLLGTITAIVLIFEKNIASGSMSPNTAYGYTDSVNTTTITLAGISVGVRQAWMRKSICQRRYFTHPSTGVNTKYWRYRAEIVIFPPTVGTDYQVLQQGYYQKLTTDATELTEITVKGTPVRYPAMLNSTGQAMLTPPITPFYKFYARPRVVEWSTLHLPNTI